MKPDLPTGPYLLTIDTATSIGSVALFAQDQLLGYQELRLSQQHARLLMPMIESLLGQVGISPNELDGIGVSQGPGSYTGLRVGVSTAKGLCYALEKPLLSLSGLQSLADAQRALAQSLSARIVPMIDARRMEVYCAIFDADGQAQTETEAKIIDAESFKEQLEAGWVIFCGNGAEKCRPILGDHPHTMILGGALSAARDMGPGIWQRWQAQQFEDLTTFEPFYLKSFRATKAKDPLAKYRGK